MFTMQNYLKKLVGTKSETKTSDMLQSCQTAVDFSEVKDVDYSDRPSPWLWR